jgi:hypothetical protein
MIRWFKNDDMVQLFNIEPSSHRTLYFATALIPYRNINIKTESKKRQVTGPFHAIRESLKASYTIHTMTVYSSIILAFYC